MSPRTINIITMIIVFVIIAVAVFITRKLVALYKAKMNYYSSRELNDYDKKNKK